MKTQHATANSSPDPTPETGAAANDDFLDSQFLGILHPTPAMPIGQVVTHINRLLQMQHARGNEMRLRRDGEKDVHVGAFSATNTDVAIHIGIPTGPQSAIRLSHASAAWLRQALLNQRLNFVGHDTQRRRFELVIRPQREGVSPCQQ